MTPQERKVFELALEALENTTPTGFNMETDKRFFAAIKAIKEALAQPEQEPVGWRVTYSKVIKALAAIVTVHTPDNLFDLDAIPRDPVMGLVQQIRVAIDGYEPPQRKWVGLTDEEIYKIYITLTNEIYPNFKTFAHAIEAKLKDKNTKEQE